MTHVNKSSDLQDDSHELMERSGRALERKRHLKAYDFANPDKFSKEKIRALEMIYANCARGLTTQLSALLRYPTSVDLEGIFETSYHDFFGSLQNSAVIALVDIEPLVGRALVETDSALSFTMIDRLLGGPGLPPSNLRDLTEIEKGLIIQVVGYVMKCVGEAWSTVIALRPSVEMIISTAQLNEVALPDDRMVVARMHITCGETTGSLQIGIPITALDPVISRLNAQHWFTTGRLSAHREFHDAILRSISKTDLEVRVELGTTVLTMREILDLQVGDLVRLKQKCTGDLAVTIGRQTKFRGQAGRVGRHLGLRVTEVVIDPDVRSNPERIKDE